MSDGDDTHNDHRLLLQPQPQQMVTTVVDIDEQQSVQDLPANRFELELEFLQALASPAYLHFLATSRSGSSEGEDGATAGSVPLLTEITPFLRYLRDTYSQPAYARFLQYPHALYFLNTLIEQPAVVKEWTLPAFRNFCHQQQFLAWQHRHAICYGVGKPSKEESFSSADAASAAK